MHQSLADLVTFEVVPLVRPIREVRLWTSRSPQGARATTTGDSGSRYLTLNVSSIPRLYT